MGHRPVCDASRRYDLPELVGNSELVPVTFVRLRPRSNRGLARWPGNGDARQRYAPAAVFYATARTLSRIRQLFRAYT